MESTEIYTKYLFKALLEIYEVSFWSRHKRHYPKQKRH